MPLAQIIGDFHQEMGLEWGIVLANFGIDVHAQPDQEKEAAHMDPRLLRVAVLPEFKEKPAKHRPFCGRVPQF